MGEGNLEGFISAIRTVVRVFDERGEINRSPLPLDLERQRHADRPLLYPGKVLADERSGSAVHRRLEPQPHRRHVARRQVDRDDRLGAAGRQRRHLPAGALLSAAGSRARSAISFTSPTPRTTRSASSISRRARCTPWPAPASRARGAARAAMRLRIDLNSPWDLALKPGILIVAMAGSHQIWVIDLLHDQAYPYAGTGEEARRDGAVNEATFAQPSGTRRRRQHAVRRRCRIQHDSRGRSCRRRIP